MFDRSLKATPRTSISTPAVTSANTAFMFGNAHARALLNFIWYYRRRRHNDRALRNIDLEDGAISPLLRRLQHAAMTAIVAFFVVHVSLAVLVPKSLRRAVKAKRNRCPVSAKRHPASIRSS
jgi:hypothetical protein